MSGAIPEAEAVEVESELEVEAEAEADEVAQVAEEITKASNSSEVFTDSFTELRLDKKLAQDVQDGWSGYINGAPSREAAGEVMGMVCVFFCVFRFFIGFVSDYLLSQVVI
jgi:hypothetical protein